MSNDHVHPIFLSILDSFSGQRPMASSGQLAYEEDCRRAPLYHDGTVRKTWLALPSWVQETWHKNPTPREYSPGDAR